MKYKVWMKIKLPFLFSYTLQVCLKKSKSMKKSVYENKSVCYEIPKLYKKNSVLVQEKQNEKQSVYEKKCIKKQSVWKE